MRGWLFDTAVHVSNFVISFSLNKIHFSLFLDNKKTHLLLSLIFFILRLIDEIVSFVYRGEVKWTWTG